MSLLDALKPKSFAPAGARTVSFDAPKSSGKRKPYKLNLTPEEKRRRKNEYQNEFRRINGRKPPNRPKSPLFNV